MLKNYLLLAWRNLSRNKLYASINILGLSIGISACLVIALIVRYEFSFDTGRKDRDRIYRIYSEFSGEFSGHNRGVSAALPAGAKSELTGIESQTGFHNWGAKVFIIDPKSSRKDFDRQSQIVIAGPEYFEVFPDHKWLAGNPASLSKPFQGVLTESKARLYFELKDPVQAVGRELHYNDSLIVTVAGIIADHSGHTDLNFSDYISLSTVPNSWLKQNIRLDDWSNTNSSSQFFVKLLPNTVPATVEKNMTMLSKKHKPKDLELNWNINYRLQPLSELHFNTSIGIFNGNGAVANIQTLKILIVVALLLLGIAAINFVNLETAQAVRRAREVGIRKVMGSTRGKLILHFLLQSTLLTVIALLIAIPIAALSIRYFKDFVPMGLKMDFTDPFVPFFLIGTTVIVSLLAGFYPAFSLSSFLPAHALKNQISVDRHQSRTSVIRKGLMVFQFTFAQALIIATIVVGWQINYVLNKDLGFTKDEVLYFDTPWRQPHSKTVAIKNELTQFPEIKSVTLCSDVPASSSYSSNVLIYNDGKKEIHQNVYRKFGDTSFISVFNLQLIAGRNIHRSDSADEYIINETYSKLLGFKKPQDAIDKILTADKKRYPIVGVVRDFNHESLHKAISPIIIADEEYNFTCLAIKLNGFKGDIGNVTKKLQTSWQKIYPDDKLEYHFLDDEIGRFYETERRISKIVTTATGVAILISCLGLFGMATLASVQRTKEIGVRKVLGATVNNIVMLLAKEFLLLVMIAFLLAAPLSWYAAEKWLGQFAYRTTVGWQIFFWTVIASFAITLISVSYQAFKAATADPVKSLRYE